MPSHDIHMTLENIYIGYGLECPEVHSTLDMFAKQLQSNHQGLLHDFRAITYYWEVEKDTRKCWCAWAHLVLDAVRKEVGVTLCVAKFLSLVQEGVLPDYDPAMLPPKVFPYFKDDGYNWSEEDRIYVKEVY